MDIKVTTLIVFIVVCLPFTLSQRPSYAGSRPPNGNKDKYRPTQSPEAIELANRFGENALANGATQRPPQGVLVVNAEPVFVPITNNQVQSSTLGSNNNVNINKAEQNPTIVGIANRNGASVPSVSSSTTSTPVRLPLDAHGDHQLINHLNQLPIDNQPFWFINYQAIEAQRNGSVTNNFGPIASRSSFLGK